MLFGFGTVIVQERASAGVCGGNSCIEPKNPLPERVLKNKDKIVTRAGFKPTTACLEGRSSIQLSYRVGFCVGEQRKPRQRPAKIKQIPVGAKPWFYLPS